MLVLYREGRIGENELIEAVAADRANAEADDPARDGAERERLDLALALDVYRAAEESGAQTLATWARRTVDPELQGGLRVAAAREAHHAEQLARRVRELGLEPAAVVPDWLMRYNAAIVDERASDADRLAMVVARCPDIGAAVAPLRERIAAIRHDALTRELLRAIAQDDEVTLRWMHEAYERKRPAS